MSRGYAPKEVGKFSRLQQIHTIQIIHSRQRSLQHGHPVLVRIQAKFSPAPFGRHIDTHHHAQAVIIP